MYHIFKLNTLPAQISYFNMGNVKFLLLGKTFLIVHSDFSPVLLKKE